MNKWGKNIKLSIFGTSHGKEIGITICGLPKGFTLDMNMIKEEMKKRRPGYSKNVSQRKEEDEFVIHSGLIKNKINGEPLKMTIANNDVKKNDYNSILRPGHVDWTAFLKYGEVLSGGGQFSGRLTAPIVFAGAIAKQIIAKRKILIKGTISSIGQIKNPSQTQIEKIVEEIRLENDSIGGTIKVVVENVPAALGSDFFGGIEAKLSSLFFSIPAVKGVEFGDGFKLAGMKGSESNDGIYVKNKKLFSKTNHMGGILGGISNGMPIIASLAIKPTPSIGKKQYTVDSETLKQTTISINGRHDSCIAIRAVPVAESIMAIGILDLLLEEHE